MKILFVMALFICVTNTWATSGRNIWKKSNQQNKEKLLNEYRIFFKHWHEKNKDHYSAFKSSPFKFSFIEEVWADTKFDCIYAGWPSKRIGGKCSSPQRNNPDYKNEKCDTNQMSCQPLLFGGDICVPTGSQSERNLAFSNCNKKFKELKRTSKDVIESIKADSKEDALFELMDLADGICKDGQQASTPMCKNLNKVIEELKLLIEKPEEEEKPLEVQKDKVETVSLPNEIVVQVIADGEPVVEPEQKADIIKSVTLSSEVLNDVAKSVILDDCPTDAKIIPFERSTPRPIANTKLAPGNSVVTFDDKIWKLRRTYVDSEKVPRSRGLSVLATPTNVGPTSKWKREWQFISEDNSRSESYIRIEDSKVDDYGKFVSSIVVLLPRKNVPSAHEVGNETHVMLTTGEKVVYDNSNLKIKGGVFKDAPIDTNAVVSNRKVAPVKYTGTGISIRIESNIKNDPRRMDVLAVVSQNDKECKVHKDKLWHDGKFKFSDDDELVIFLNKLCGNKFKLPESP